jgi:hypothetical protein
MKKENITEYNGEWHKKDEYGNCKPFIMRDLEKLLKQVRKEERERILNIVWRLYAIDKL